MTLWEKTKVGSKAGFDKLYGWVDKLGPPVNRLSNKLGAEAFWPTTLDKESDKAARILRSFCKDGFYQEEAYQTAEGPKGKQRVLKKIPTEVIRNAKGLAIFTTMRTGLWLSGAGGSGILVGRLPDGSWSPPSGLMLHTAGVGFLLGVDIYDCVMVINTDEALQAFTRIRCTIGGEMSAVAGPVGMGGVFESEVHKRRAPIFTYLKSRGFYAGVQLDGTILIERNDENERFYGQKLSGLDIISGKVRHAPYETRSLTQTIKAAQGDGDVDESFLPTEPPPSDFEITESDKAFGVPDKDDPDPYGFLALEKEGLQIREAGSQQRGSIDQFTFNPLPTSPIYSTFSRNSIDGNTTVSRRTSWRNSILSTNTTSMTDRSAHTTDMSTQTEFDSPAMSPALSGRGVKMADIKEEPVKKMGPPPSLPPRALPPVEQSEAAEPVKAVEPEDSTDLADLAETIKAAESGESAKVPETVRPMTPTNQISFPIEDNPYKADNEDSEQEDDGIDEEQPVVHEVKKAASPKFIARARLVTVQKRPPPTLPPRNPGRDRRPIVVDANTSTTDEVSGEHLSPPQTHSHSRRSSESTYREESSAGQRSYSEASISSVEQLSGLEKHLAQFKHTDEMEMDKDVDTFHSIPVTPATEGPDPIQAKA